LALADTWHLDRVESDPASHTIVRFPADLPVLTDLRKDNADEVAAMKDPLIVCSAVAERLTGSLSPPFCGELLVSQFTL